MTTYEITDVIIFPKCTGCYIFGSLETRLKFFRAEIAGYNNEKPKLILVSDIFGRSLMERLMFMRGNDYKFSSSLAVSGTTDVVLENIEQKAKTLTRKDCVVIITGSNDFSINSAQTVVEWFERPLAAMKHTNVIIGSIPNSPNPDAGAYNEFAREVEMGLADRYFHYDHVFLQNIDASFVDEDYGPSGFTLNGSAELKVARALNRTLRNINIRFYNGLHVGGQFNRF